MEAYTTLTPAEREAITAKLKEEGWTLPRGLGDRQSACSIASINLALNNTLTDDIPRCMSAYLGGWIIRTQDQMPDCMRNGEWKWLLPDAAGTGRLDEDKIAAILTDYDQRWEALPYTVKYRPDGCAWETVDGYEDDERYKKHVAAWAELDPVATLKACINATRPEGWKIK